MNRARFRKSWFVAGLMIILTPCISPLKTYAVATSSLELVTSDTERSQLLDLMAQRLHGAKHVAELIVQGEQQLPDSELIMDRLSFRDNGVLILTSQSSGGNSKPILLAIGEIKSGGSYSGKIEWRSTTLPAKGMSPEGEAGPGVSASWRGQVATAGERGTDGGSGGGGVPGATLVIAIKKLPSLAPLIVDRGQAGGDGGNGQPGGHGGKGGIGEPASQNLFTCVRGSGNGGAGGPGGQGGDGGPGGQGGQGGTVIIVRPVNTGEQRLDIWTTDVSGGAGGSGGQGGGGGTAGLGGRGGAAAQPWCKNDGEAGSPGVNGISGRIGETGKAGSDGSAKIALVDSGAFAMWGLPDPSLLQRLNPFR